MIRPTNADGTYTHISDEEFIATHGQEVFDLVNEPSVKPARIRRSLRLYSKPGPTRSL